MDSLVYASRPLQQLETDFKTSFDKGLSHQVRIELQKKFGRNGLASKHVIWPSLLWRQFSSSFMYLLVGAAILSFFLESKINAIIILTIVLCNGLISFYQEYRASKSLEFLKQQLQHYSQVLSDGVFQSVPSTSLVPGDVVLLDAGNYVPADVRIVAGHIQADESMLSGESLPVEKNSTTKDFEVKTSYEASNMGFLGTMIVSGSARALVVSIGKETIFGQVSKAAQESIEQSGFQERLRTLSNFLLMVIGLTVPFLFLVHVLVKGSRIDVLELLLFSLALIIGLIPEALPTVTTFALSNGALILAKHHVIVKRLSAIEDLGSITLLCTDKTGTLTENILEVVSFYSEQNIPLKLYAYLTAARPKTDPFDAILLKEFYEEVNKEGSLFRHIDDQPFDSEKRTSAVLVQKNEQKILVVRGAVEDVVARCSVLPNAVQRDTWRDKQAQEGNRVLALAFKNNPTSLSDNELSFAGLISFADPVKESAKEAIKNAQRLGVQVKMITGDSKEVGSHVANNLGLLATIPGAIAGEEFEELSMQEKIKTAKNYSVFARFLPHQKRQLVEIFRQEHYVGFLGDGINDAPALKAAHVGIVVHHATDITKEIADIVLTRKSLSAIIDGISIGRRVFANTIKYIITSISSNFGNFYSIAIASLFIDFLPLLPRQILLINILSDFPMIALATDTVDSAELKKPPHFNIKDIALITTVLGIISSVFDFMFFAFFFHARPALMQTGWFLESLFTEIVLIFSLRTHRPFFKARRPSFTLLFLCGVSVTVALYLILTSVGERLFHFTTPSPIHVLIIGVLVVSYFIVTDLAKLAYYALFNRVNNKLS